MPEEPEDPQRWRLEKWKIINKDRPFRVIRKEKRRKFTGVRNQNKGSDIPIKLEESIEIEESSDMRDSDDENSYQIIEEEQGEVKVLRSDNPSKTFDYLQQHYPQLKGLHIFEAKLANNNELKRIFATF